MRQLTQIAVRGIITRIRKNIFAMRVIRHSCLIGDWGPREAVGYPSMPILQTGLDVALSNLI